jgi:drug/metabolite transporter (DMT)-like permease
VILAVALSLGAAVLLAVGFVVQQRAAAREPESERLSFRLLFQLVQRPLWLGGLAAQVGGQVLGAVALGTGSLGLVEPVMAANLLFALPLSAAWSRRRLGRREWAGAAALLAGLAAFIGAGDPRGGAPSHLPWPNWVLSGGTIAALVALFVAFARRRENSEQATILAAAAGMLYGLQDALTQRTMAVLGNGPMAVLVAWPAFALVAVAIVGMLLAQSAFEAAPLAASLPAITALEPITGIAFGVGAYHEYLDLSGGNLVVEIVGLLVAIVGVYLVAASPLVTGGPARPCPAEAPDEGARGPGVEETSRR